jgi:hypothetical protein
MSILHASSTQYFVMMGATLLSIKVRTCFTTADSSARKRLGEFVKITVGAGSGFVGFGIVMGCFGRVAIKQFSFSRFTAPGLPA